MNAISLWTATAADGLSHSTSLFDRKHAGYKFSVSLTTDSLWLKANFKGGNKMAFRMAFFSSDSASVKALKENGSEVVFLLESLSMNYEVRLQFIHPDAPEFRYTTTVNAKFPMLIPFWPKDLLPLTKAGKVQEEGEIHAAQVGTRSAMMYFSMTKPKTGSVFYFQNLTALNPFFEATKTSGGEVVGGEWPEIGFSLPVFSEEALPANQDFVISDAFVRLSDEIPSGDIEITQGFLNHLAALYLQIPKPEPEYHEWRETAEKGMDGVADHKGCWTFAGGHPYLNAYLCDYKTPPEVMVQLAVLLPLLEYCDWKGEMHKMTGIIRDGLPAFFSEELGTLVRWLPAMVDQLDESEEQKQEGVMDSWYLHHPLTNLIRLAVRGDDMAKDLVEKSIDYPIQVAKHFKYNWPVFYDMKTLEVLKAETQPGKGGEKDVPGAYAKMLLEMWKLNGDKKYLEEAKKAVEHLRGLAFDIFYQANNTAFAAVALLRLYKNTKDKSYLDLSYACLASIFKNVQLWDCNYGNAKHFPTFFAVFPLSDAPYTAAYEEQEVYSTLHGYLLESADVEILPSVRLLLSEFVRHAIGRMPYYLPPMLPEEILAEEIKTGEIDPALWVPLEDIHDGWERSGEVGQEVYGACIAFGIVPRQYIKIPGIETNIFIDYPITDIEKQDGKSVKFKVLGDGRMNCRLIIFNQEETAKWKVAVKQDPKDKAEVLPVQKQEENQLEYQLTGDCVVEISC